MKVLMIAMEEFKSFMSGQKSAEEVSKLIQNRVKIYLNE
jgi:multiple sugar transport system substrate-binding protein